MTSRERFEAWITAPPYEKRVDISGHETAWPGQYNDYGVQLAWEAWQAAEAQAAQRCAEIADQIGTHDGDVMVHSISAEYPEAFK